MKKLLKTPGKSCLVAGMVSIIMMLVYSCGQNNPAAADELPRLEASLQTMIDTIFAGDRDTMILVKNGQAFVKGQIKDSAEKIKYTLPVWSDQKVTGVITSVDTGAHIMINQIKHPGQKIKNFFSYSVDINITANGNVDFFVGRNGMADENNTGNFILHVTVK